MLDSSVYKWIPILVPTLTCTLHLAAESRQYLPQLALQFLGVANRFSDLFAQTLPVTLSQSMDRNPNCVRCHMQIPRREIVIAVAHVAFQKFLETLELRFLSARCKFILNPGERLLEKRQRPSPVEGFFRSATPGQCD